MNKFQIKFSKNKFDPIMSFTSKEYENFYEPSEDSWLLVDGLESDLVNSIPKNQSCLIAEIGSGSGFVSGFVHKLLKFNSISHFLFLTDINPKANVGSFITMKKNNVSNFDIIRTPFCSCFKGGILDVIIFNPPYVPSEKHELKKTDIRCSYAGGEKGREIIDEFLPTVQFYLKKSGCILYLICIEVNQPRKIIEMMATKEYGEFKGEIIKEKKSMNEHLYLLKFSRN